MGKRSTSGMALAIALCGMVPVAATQSFAAPGWLEKVFAPDHPKPAKKRKARPADKQPGQAIRLPETAPLPQAAAPRTPQAVAQEPQDQPSPETPPDALPDAVLEAAPADPPKPQSRPDELLPEALEPSAPPRPEPRPDMAAPDASAPDPAQPAAPRLEADPRSADVPDPSGELPTEEVACRRRLTELGVAFTEHKAESDPEGCAIPYPLTVASLGAEIGLQPEAEMNCAMAEATARFARDVVSPHAQNVFHKKLASISHASAYVCRPRAGTLRLSEHAFGNALDIASFTLADGTSVVVELDPPENNRRFVDTVRRSACGPFKTVLGPGDPDHSGHLHIDLAPRRNGGIVCE